GFCRLAFKASSLERVVIGLHSSNFLRACPSSVSAKEKDDALLPPHRTLCQNPLLSRHMTLNELIEPWCQYSILRKRIRVPVRDFLFWMPPSLVYCCHRSTSRNRTAAVRNVAPTIMLMELPMIE